MYLLLALLVLPSVLAQINDTIVDALKSSTHEQDLVGYVQQAGLTDVLATGGPFTFFSPDDRAFNALPAATLSSLKNDSNAMADLLKYHIVSGTYKAADLKVNELMLQTLAGTQLRINYYSYNHRLTVEGAAVTFQDKIVKNGVIHRVSQVLTPPIGTIADVLSSDPDLSELMAAVQTAGLTNMLTDSGPLTLMAPSNYGFNALGNDTMTKLTANPAILAAVLKYHLIHGTLYSAGMHSESLNTLELHDRQRLYAGFIGSLVVVDGARVSAKDMSATNGVVHKINHVLIPHSLRHQISAL